MKTIHEVLQSLRDVSLDERDKGNHFESLTKRWLEISPEYADIFEKVWTYPEWAAENDLPKTDVGIDLVAREVATGDLCAIQCKFYDPGTSIDKRHIDSFFTALSKKSFSSGIIFSTSTKWSKHAEDALAETTKPVVRVGLHDLEESGVDWDKFSLKNPGKLELKTKKTPYKHQELAINDVLQGFANQDRGKLIMACGTGKTFTSLKIAEAMVPDGGTMLFLVPSIALLSQSLKEWKQEAERPITAYAVCSDSKVGKSKDDEDIQVTDLAYPATTNAKKLIAHFNNSKPSGEGFTVIFSTYQSIDVISKAQALGVPEFDLIVCDEAHRTTGVKLADADESSFIRVHDNKFVDAKKRLYMTATPRIYAEQSKQKALESDATLASMDDESYYGGEFHRLNFGKAVSESLLSDYKVLVLAVSEDHVSRQLQNLLTKDGELNLDDATKIVGCYNGLLKRSSNPEDFVVDKSPMRSAVAFSRSIKDSKRLANLFEVVTSELNKNEESDNALTAEADHVDGTYNMESRLEKLDWLKEKTTGTVRILSNARCLSEGVDVPALDAVLFLNPRDSQVDVVQSVGRVMRKSPGKQYGYVILPITVPAGKTAEEALSDNNKYKIVWQVLQALRAHDERFDAMVNKIDLNGDADDRLRVIGIGGEGDDESLSKSPGDKPLTLDFPIGEWKDAILAKIVQKVGQRTYWENWAKDVATIAKDHIGRINQILDEKDAGIEVAFGKFLTGIRENLNPYVTQELAVEMLAQHLITKPVFDALFENYAFTAKNPVSLAMQSMVNELEARNISPDTESLESFYESVRVRVQGITDGAAKQKVVKELYEKFFKIAFSDVSDRLGIVYTPNEVVDFIIRSADDALKNDFSSSLSSKGVNVLDPFTGTGTFVVRLLQSGLIPLESLRTKYSNEIHANELVLLAYYVAAINIEETFHSLFGGEYEPFEGIVLTDTFQMYEKDDKDEQLGLEVFPENNSRVLAQKSQPIQVIIGNPPYSVGQSSANDNNQNLKYPTLDSRISETYAVESNAQLKSKIYDSYFRALRWASDRVGDDGIVCFVTNGGFVDSSSADGLRKSFAKEFNKIYVYNLRGDANTSGAVRKAEGGGIFGEGSRTPAAITMLIRRKGDESFGNVFYAQMDDGLSRQSKLEQLNREGSYINIDWKQLFPNSAGDWINQRNQEFESFLPLGEKGESSGRSIFKTHAHGLVTARDAWVVNFSEAKVVENVSRLIEFYNGQVDALQQKSIVLDQLSSDSKKISWSRAMKNSADKGLKFEFDSSSLREMAYRPFMKQKLYFNRQLNEIQSQLPKLFPTDESNFGIVIAGAGTKTDFSCLMVNRIPSFHLLPNSQFFPRYQGDVTSGDSLALFGDSTNSSDNISESAVELLRAEFGDVTSDDVFFYVYGILHSPTLRKEFAADFRKVLARVPVSKNFLIYSDAGRKLADLHLNYETLEPWGQLVGSPNSPKVHRMVYRNETADAFDIDYGNGQSLASVPRQVLDFKVGTRSPLDWVVDRYQVKTDKDSGIVNDPNEWDSSAEGLYSIDLSRKLIEMTLQTQKIIAGLPKESFIRK
jgi:predicted helicase